jgi:hypothetical protein
MVGAEKFKTRHILPNRGAAARRTDRLMQRFRRRTSAQKRRRIIQKITAAFFPLRRFPVDLRGGAFAVANHE